jgi:hypothetical protein
MEFLAQCREGSGSLWSAYEEIIMQTIQNLNLTTNDIE